MSRSPLSSPPVAADVKTLAELIARVERATKPDREIDGAIWSALVDPDRLINTWHVPPYTASIDAAVALVKKISPTAAWTVEGGGGSPRGTADLFTGPNERRADITVEEAPTPALAICSALLRALHAQASAKQQQEQQNSAETNS